MSIFQIFVNTFLFISLGGFLVLIFVAVTVKEPYSQFLFFFTKLYFQHNKMNVVEIEIGKVYKVIDIFDNASNYKGTIELLTVTIDVQKTATYLAYNANKTAAVDTISIVGSGISCGAENIGFLGNIFSNKIVVFVEKRFIVKPQS